MHRVGPVKLHTNIRGGGDTAENKGPLSSQLMR